MDQIHLPARFRTIAAMLALMVAAMAGGVAGGAAPAQAQVESGTLVDIHQPQHHDCDDGDDCGRNDRGFDDFVGDVADVLDELGDLVEEVLELVEDIFD